MLHSPRDPRPQGRRCATAALPLLLLAAAVPACVEPSLDPAPITVSTVTSAALAPGEHEPLIGVFTRVFRAFEPRSFELTGISRDFSIELNWWANGTPYPSLFRLTGTFPGGASFTTEQGPNPVLNLPYLPGQTSAMIEIDHESQSPEFQGKLIIREPIRPDELGGCGDSIRDRFVGWVRSQRDWETNPQVQHVFEKLPNELRIGTCGGLCTQTIYVLLGSLAALPGSRGPILQIEEREPNPYQREHISYYLLFYDEQGSLLRKVAGRLFFVLPDGNLFISTGIANSSDFNPTEAVASITPLGVTSWSRSIGGIPPGTVITTAAGNLAMPWRRDIYAGLPVFDPHTGATVDESFLDRGALCTASSTSAACTAQTAAVQAALSSWWDRTWPLYGSWITGPFRTCNSTSCTTGSLSGWLVFGDELVLEVNVDYRGIYDNESQNYKRLLFIGLADHVEHGAFNGAFYRRLGDDRLLVSGIFGSWGIDRTREYYGESFAALGPSGAVAWRRAIAGPPALLRSTGNTYGSAGYLLDGNRLFWGTYTSINGNGASTSSWINLATGALLPVPALRSLENLCKPH